MLSGPVSSDPYNSPLTSGSMQLFRIAFVSSCRKRLLPVDWNASSGVLGYSEFIRHVSCMSFFFSRYHAMASSVAPRSHNPSS